MTHMLSALLCLGLYLDQRMRTQADASMNPCITQSPGNPPNRTPTTSGLPKRQGMILLSISAFLILFFVFFLLFLCLRRCWHQTKFRKRDRETETKMPSKSSGSVEIPLEEILCVDVNKDRRTEEAITEDTAAPPREESQEVTYALLNLNSLKMGVKNPNPSGLGESLYATLQRDLPDPRGPQEEETSLHSASAF